MLPIHKKQACLKMAADIGKYHAWQELHKTAGIRASLIPLLAPAAIGAIIAGEGHRIPGGAAGLLAGIAGAKLLRPSISRHFMRAAQKSSDRLGTVIGGAGGALLGGAIIGQLRENEIEKLTKKIEELSAQHGTRQYQDY